MLGNNYLDAQNKELSDLEKLYSELKIATGDSSQITVNVEDLNKFINDRVNEKVAEINSNMDATVANLRKEFDEKLNEKMQSSINGITEDSILLSSVDKSLGTGDVTLNSFNNTFTNKFSNYFEHNVSDDVLICKEDGWYYFSTTIRINGPSVNWSETGVYITLNDVQLLWTDRICLYYWV